MFESPSLRLIVSPKPWALAVAISVALISPLLGLDMVVSGGYHDTQRWLELAVFAVIALLALCRLSIGSLQMANPNATGSRLLLALGTLGLISTAISPFPAHACFEVGYFFFLFLTAWLVGHEVAHKPSVRLRQALSWVVVGSLFYAFKTLVVYGAALAYGSQPYVGDLIPGFDNFRFFNHAQTITLPLLGLFVCLVGTGEARDRRWLIAGWLALSWWWTLLFLTSGRGTFFGLVAAMTIALLVRRSLAWPWLRTMALGAFAGAVIYGLVYVAVPHLFGLEPFGLLGRVVQRSVDNLGSGRADLWSCAIQMVVTHPWFGAGPLHYAQACASVGYGAHPHNWVLQIASEWGLLVLGCLGVLLVLAFRSLLGCGKRLRTEDKPNQAVLACWLATGAAILVDGLVSGILVMPVSQLWISVYVGLAWGWTRSTGCLEPVLECYRAWRLVAGGVVILAACLTIIGVATTYTTTTALMQSPESSRLLLSPRAWAMGYFFE